MKRDFLKNFKVGDQMLPDEIVDAIMAENGRDIEAAKKPFADYDTVKNQLSEAQKTIKGFQDQGADIESVRKSAKDCLLSSNQIHTYRKTGANHLRMHKPYCSNPPVSLHRCSMPTYRNISDPEICTAARQRWRIPCKAGSRWHQSKSR